MSSKNTNEIEPRVKKALNDAMKKKVTIGLIMPILKEYDAKLSHIRTRQLGLELALRKIIGNDLMTENVVTDSMERAEKFVGTIHHLAGSLSTMSFEQLMLTVQVWNQDQENPKITIKQFEDKIEEVIDKANQADIPRETKAIFLRSFGFSENGLVSLGFMDPTEAGTIEQEKM